MYTYDLDECMLINAHALAIMYIRFDGVRVWCVWWSWKSVLWVYYVGVGENEKWQRYTQRRVGWGGKLLYVVMEKQVQVAGLVLIAGEWKERRDYERASYLCIVTTKRVTVCTETLLLKFVIRVWGGIVDIVSVIFYRAAQRNSHILMDHVRYEIYVRTTDSKWIQNYRRKNCVLFLFCAPNKNKFI